MDPTYERIQTHLQELKLQRIPEVLDRVAEDAAKAEWTYLDFLERLLSAEAEAKDERGVATRIRMARFPFHKTLEQFDFSFQPSIDKRKINELSKLRFIEDGENLMFLGPPGVGKTHLAIALGIKAAHAGYRVLFLSIADLIDQLAKAFGEHHLDDKMRTLCQPKLLIIDEMGYLPLDQQASHFFFQVVSRRYEKGAIILTSNKSYGDWGSIFAADHVIASAILDRLLHHSTTLNIKGESYRLKDKRRSGLVTLQQGNPALVSSSDSEGGVNFKPVERGQF